MKHFKSFKTIIEKLFFILPEQKIKRGYALIVIIMIGSLLETLGVSAILPFVTAILTPEELLDKWYVQIISNGLGVTDASQLIIILGIGIIIVYLAKNVYLYSSLIIQAMYRSRVQKDLSTQMLGVYMKRDYEYYTGINSSDLMRAIGIDIFGVYNLLDNLFKFTGELFTAVLISAFIIYTDPIMAVCIIVIAGICFYVLTVGLKKKTANISQIKRITDAARGKSAMQAFMGFKEIKVTCTEDFFVRDYEEAYENQRKAEVKNEFIVNIPEKLIEFVCIATLIGVICVRIQMGVDMTHFIPKLSVFAVAAFRLLPSVSRMTRYMNGVVYNKIFLENAYQSFSEIRTYDVNVQQQKLNLEEKFVFENKVEVKELSWIYRNTTKVILDKLSLEIGRGESIGIMGASGSGKTTLIDILLGLLKPENGTILVDGKNILEEPEQWSSLVAYVPQNVFLLDSSIRKNVAFGYEESEIDDAKIWSVLEEAQLKDFVEGLPEGLDMQVGERGIKFSGGQRQRIAIARALYRNPEIIVLDEATSALDGETEKAVMESIELLRGKKTLVIVAHRLSTLKQCDKVYEITDGKAALRNIEELV